MFIIEKIINFVIDTVMLVSFSAIHSLKMCIPCILITYLLSIIFNLCGMGIINADIYKIELIVLSIISILQGINSLQTIHITKMAIEFHKNIKDDEE